MINKTSIITTALIAALAAAYAASQTDQRPEAQAAEPPAPASDQIVASFERALNHESTEVRPVKRDDIDNDVLYWMVNRVHWTSEQREQERSDAEGQDHPQ